MYAMPITHVESNLNNGELNHRLLVSAFVTGVCRRQVYHSFLTFRGAEQLTHISRIQHHQCTQRAFSGQEITV